MIASPCHFCGSHQLDVEAAPDFTMINCLRCHAIGPGPMEQSQAEAWERWNRRASPADGSGLALVDSLDDSVDLFDLFDLFDFLDFLDFSAISELSQPTACFVFVMFVLKTHFQKGHQ